MGNSYSIFNFINKMCWNTTLDKVPTYYNSFPNVIQSIIYDYVFEDGETFDEYRMKNTRIILPPPYSRRIRIGGNEGGFGQIIGGSLIL